MPGYPDGRASTGCAPTHPPCGHRSSQAPARPCPIGESGASGPRNHILFANQPSRSSEAQPLLVGFRPDPLKEGSTFFIGAWLGMGSGSTNRVLGYSIRSRAIDRSITPLSLLIAHLSRLVELPPTLVSSIGFIADVRKIYLHTDALLLQA